MDIKNFVIKIRAPFKRIGLKNKDYSIISNNCWGGVVSRDRGIKYNSPTCGLFFYAKDYLKFLSNLDYYLNSERTEISIYESKYRNDLQKRCDDSLVIGVLDDIELIMLHYKSFEEAKTKWNRRKKRINYDNLLVKFSDQNLFTEEDFEKFKRLPFKNKLFITTNDSYNSNITCVIPDKWGCGYAKDDIKPSFKVLKVNKLLNSLIS